MPNPDCEARNCTNEATEVVEDENVVFCGIHMITFLLLTKEDGYPVEVAISVLCD